MAKQGEWTYRVVEASDAMAELGDEPVLFPAQAMVMASRDGGPSVALHLRLLDGQPEIVQVLVSAGGEAVEAAAFHAIPLSTLRTGAIDEVSDYCRQLAALDVARRHPPGSEATPEYRTDVIERVHWPHLRRSEAAHSSLRRRTIDDRLLRRVAEVYMDAQAAGEPPTRAVQLHADTASSHRTATRYVALARQRGFLPPYSPSGSASNSEEE